MPSLSSLRAHLNSFLVLSSASEIVLFERTTFLVISSVTNDKDAPDAEWDERRFERISTMVKAFKLGCSCVFHLAIAAVSTETGLLTRSPAMLFTSSFAGSKIRSPFSSLAITTPRYTAVLDALTPETYILVVAKGQIRASLLCALSRSRETVNPDVYHPTPSLAVQNPLLSSSIFDWRALTLPSSSRSGWDDEQSPGLPRRRFPYGLLGIRCLSLLYQHPLSVLSYYVHCCLRYNASATGADLELELARLAFDSLGGAWAVAQSADASQSLCMQT